MSQGKAAIAVALGILLLVVVFAPVPGDTRFLYALHNAAHGLVFGCMALLVLLWQRRFVQSPRSQFMQYAIAFAAAIVLGIGTELAQAVTGRDASWLDVRNDLLGALAMLLFFFAFESTSRERFNAPMRALASVVALGLCAFLAAPLVRSGFEYWQRDRQFPTIVDFTRDYDRYFIFQQSAELGPAAMPPQWALGRGENALRVRLIPGEYPGIDFIEPRPDWTPYHALMLDLTNPGAEDLRFRVRIHDTVHNQAFEDRYNGEVTLRARSRQTIRIPLQDVRRAPQGRAMQLDEIAGLMMFLLEPSRGEFLLSRVWLE